MGHYKSGKLLGTRMDLTFDEIPEDLWEDWVWLVSPAGLMRTVEEETQPLLSSPYQLTSTYSFNLPKLVLFSLVWSFRMDQETDVELDLEDLHPAVRMDADTALRGLSLLLRSYPLVLRWKIDQDRLLELAPNLWDDVQAPPELLWYVPQELEGRTLDLDSISIDFFNPFVPSLKLMGMHRSVIGVISPVRSLEKVAVAMQEEEGNDLREALDTSLEELEVRGLIERVADGRRRITEKGTRMVETEPLSDCLSCRCRVEEVMEYEMSGDED